MTREHVVFARRTNSAFIAAEVDRFPLTMAGHKAAMRLARKLYREGYEWAAVMDGPAGARTTSFVVGV